jgi:hypothetical protein
VEATDTPFTWHGRASHNLEPQFSAILAIVADVGSPYLPAKVRKDLAALGSHVVLKGMWIFDQGSKGRAAESRSRSERTV